MSPAPGQPLRDSHRDLSERNRHVFRSLVEAFVATGQPVGSRLLTERTGLGLSPASIRASMQELEARGLLAAPHVSAGRVPTEAGLRLFVDQLMQAGELAAGERAALEARCQADGRSVDAVLAAASATLSGLSACAGLVVAPKAERPLRQIEFVALGPTRLLIILVGAEGTVENRLIDLPQPVSVAVLQQAANYLNHRVLGRTLAEIRLEVEAERQARQDALDRATQQVVDAGMAVWAQSGAESARSGVLILRGQSHLLSDVRSADDADNLRRLFDQLEADETALKLLDAAEKAEGVRVFIGAETPLFGSTGMSMVIAPARDAGNRVIGAVGIIGPTRLPYARVVPMVDYTAQLVSRVLG